MRFICSQHWKVTGVYYRKKLKKIKKIKKLKTESIPNDSKSLWKSKQKQKNSCVLDGRPHSFNKNE